MTKLEQYQSLVDAAGIRGKVEKVNGTSYILRPEKGHLWWLFGDEPYWLGDSQDTIKRSVAYLADVVEREHYHEIALERYPEHQGDFDPELRAWREEQEWLNWWHKAS